MDRLRRWPTLRTFLPTQGAIRTAVAQCSFVPHDFALGGVEFAEEAGHQRVRLGIIITVPHILHYLLVRLLLSFPERILQEVLGAPFLRPLLLQNVVQQILVPLYEPIGVHLPVLDLLLSVALDSSEQCLHLVLLPLPERTLFLC